MIKAPRVIAKEAEIIGEEHGQQIVDDGKNKYFLSGPARVFALDFEVGAGGLRRQIGPSLGFLCRLYGRGPRHG